MTPSTTNWSPRVSALTEHYQETVRLRYEHNLMSAAIAGYGKKRAKPTKHFLRDACDALIAGNEVAMPVTKPLRYFIYFETSETQPAKWLLCV